MRIGLVGAICSALPWGETLVPGVSYVFGPVPMLSAMLLPMTLTILDIYARLARGRGDRLVLPRLERVAGACECGAVGVIVGTRGRNGRSAGPRVAQTPSRGGLRSAGRGRFARVDPAARERQQR